MCYIKLFDDDDDEMVRCPSAQKQLILDMDGAISKINLQPGCPHVHPSQHLCSGREPTKIMWYNVYRLWTLLWAMVYHAFVCQRKEVVYTPMDSDGFEFVREWILLDDEE